MANFKKYTKKNGQEAWQFSAYLGTDPKTGKRIKTTRRGFDTKKQAQRACSQLLAEFDADTWAAMQSHSNTEPTTFKEVAELWLTSYKLTVQDVTYQGTKNILKNYLYPKFGDRPIKDITRVECQQAVNDWYLQYSALGAITCKASRIFKYALTMDLISINPMESVIKPKADAHKRVKVYTKQEFNTLMAYLKDNQSDYDGYFMYALFRLLFFTGLRINEALALEWSDIDFKAKTLNINKTLKLVDRKLTVGKPKTKASVAVLPVDDQTLRILKTWRAYKKKARLAIGLTGEPPIFSKLDGEWVFSSDVYYQLRRATKNAGVPFYGNHVTRHTHASFLIEAGANLKEVQTRLRHGSITVTMDTYGHLSKEFEVGTLDKFVDFVNGIQNGSQ